MLNEVKHLYNKDSSLPLRLRSGLKAQNDIYIVTFFFI